MKRSDEKNLNRRDTRRFASDYQYNHNQGPTGERPGRRRFTNDNIVDYPSGREYSNDNGNDHSREYEYNRFGMGDQRGTWNQRGDESYDFGENNRRDKQNPADAKHRGKGPKGFKRSDDSIRDDINSRLTDDAYLDASEIEVVIENGEVTLSGTVPDKASKRRAEDICELVSGVSNVENRLRVK
jgi:hypothetical protein